MAEDKKQFDEQMRAMQLKRAELENQKLERDIALMENAEQNRGALARRNGQTLRANNEGGEKKIAGCNHKKGGKGLEGFRGRGDGKAGGYAVIQHMFPNGDIGVFCQRCPKIWLPPVFPNREELTKEEFELANKAYDKDHAAWRWALALPTDNEMSTSGLFRGGNFEEDCREVLHAAAEHPQDV